MTFFEKKILRYQGKYLSGSAVIEMAYIMPVFLFLFLIIVHTTFYFHDKVILTGAAGETAVVGAQLERRKGTEEYDLEEMFRERINGKLVYMKVQNIEIEKTDERITVEAGASRSFMNFTVCQSAFIAKPEEKIRWINWK